MASTRIGNLGRSELGIFQLLASKYSALGAVTVRTSLFDPLLSVRLPVPSYQSCPCAGARLRRGSQQGARDLQGWERSGNEISLRQGTPDARRPLTCPNLARSPLGSGLQTAARNKRLPGVHTRADLAFCVRGRCWVRTNVG